ncbi:MAG: hypothetical protein IH951_11595 [Bacteroidetes bacterium]|nr:hypothetical protein [Bacteroidota bacterium]
MDKLTSDALLVKAQKDVSALLADNWDRIENMIEDAYDVFKEQKAPESEAQFKFSITHATVVKKKKNQFLCHSDIGYGLRVSDHTAPTPIGPDSHPQLPGTEPPQE